MVNFQGNGMLSFYALVGVSVGRGRAGRRKVGRTNDDRGKDVVPLIMYRRFSIRSRVNMGPHTKEEFR